MQKAVKYPQLCGPGTLSRTEEQAMAGTCARDRRALQQLGLNVHIKNWPDLTRPGLVQVHRERQGEISHRELIPDAGISIYNSRIRYEKQNTDGIKHLISIAAQR